MKKLFILSVFSLLVLFQCQEQPIYPNEPLIDYERFYIYVDTNSNNEPIITGKVEFSFTDGDGNIGFDPVPTDSGVEQPDSIKYNLFLQMYDLQNRDTILIEDENGGLLKHTIPYINRQSLQGTISVKIEYPIIKYDTILYTFYLYDRDYNRSNTDTTDFRILSGILDN